MPRQDTRRVTTSKLPGGRLAPPPSLNPVASIRAPRPDNSAAVVADQLMNILGVGTRAYAMHADERDRELAEQGANDALAGTVDPEKQKWQAYNDAAGRIGAEAAAVRDETEVSEGAKPFIENSDKAGLNTYLNEQYVKRWGGADGAELRVVGPRWLKLKADLEAQLVATAKEQSRVSDEANFATVFESAVQTGSVDYTALNAKAHELFGVDTPAVMSRVVAEMIDKHKAPWLLDEMPDEVAPGIPSVKRHPKHASGLRGIAEKATDELARGRAGEREIQLNKVFEHIDYRIANQQWLSDKEINEGVELGFYDAGKASEIRRRQLSEQEQARKAAKENYNLNGAFATGDWSDFAGVISKEKISKAFDAYVDQSTAGMDGQQKTAFALSASMRNGLVYGPLASSLSNPNLEDAGRLSAQLAQFRQMFEVAPKIARKYVTDNDTVDLYLSLDTLEKIGYDPAQKLTAAKQVDPETRRLQWEQGGLKKAVQKRLQSMKLSRPGTFFQPKGRSLANQFFYEAEASRIANSLGKTGMFDNADAVVSTMENILKTRYVVLGDIFVPRTPDMPQDMDKAWEWFHEGALSELLKSTNLKPDQVQLRPDGRTGVDGQTYGLFFKGLPEPVPLTAGKRFTLDKLYTAYRQSQIAERTRPQRELWQKAIDENFQPTNLPGSPFTLWQYETDRKSLSPTQRADLDKRFYPLALKEHEKAVEKLKRRSSETAGTQRQQAEADKWREFMQAIQPD